MKHNSKKITHEATTKINLYILSYVTPPSQYNSGYNNPQFWLHNSLALEMITYWYNSKEYTFELCLFFVLYEKKKVSV